MTWSCAPIPMPQHFSITMLPPKVYSLSLLSNPNIFSSCFFPLNQWFTGQGQKCKSYDIFLPKKTKKPPITSLTRPFPLHSNHGLNTLASSSQTIVNHVNSKGTAQMKPLGRVQRWTDALKHAYKAFLWSQLFDDALVCPSVFAMKSCTD